MQPGLAWDDNGEMFVKNVLEPHTQNISNIIITSWEKYLQINDDSRYPLNSRTRANIVNDYICHEIRHTFDNVSGISILDKLGFLVLNFSDIVLLRFKFLDNRLRAGNVQTQQQLNYDNLVTLPGFPPQAFRVMVGYQLDKTETQIKNILVTRPMRRRIVWHYSILTENVSTIQPKLNIIDSQDMLEKASKKRKIKPKNLEAVSGDDVGGTDPSTGKDESKNLQEPGEDNDTDGEFRNDDSC